MATKDKPIQMGNEDKCLYYHNCFQRRNNQCKGLGEENCKDYISLEESSFRHDLDLIKVEITGRLMK